MSHHVSVRMPDGREAVADYRQPITHVMRRLLKAGPSPDPADLEALAEWLDHCPEQQCTWESLLAGACTGHGPALAEPFTPPRYQRPVLDGLW